MSLSFCLCPFCILQYFSSCLCPPAPVFLYLSCLRLLVSVFLSRSSYGCLSLSVFLKLSSCVCLCVCLPASVILSLSVSMSPWLSHIVIVFRYLSILSFRLRPPEVFNYLSSVPVSASVVLFYTSATVFSSRLCLLFLYISLFFCRMLIETAVLSDIVTVFH